MPLVLILIGNAEENVTSYVEAIEITTNLLHVSSQFQKFITTKTTNLIDQNTEIVIVTIEQNMNLNYDFDSYRY